MPHSIPRRVTHAKLVFAFVAACLTLAASGQSTSASDLRFTAIVKAVQAARPAVVNIHGHKTVASGNGEHGIGDGLRRVNGMGTGVILDERGYIITNYHVVDGVRQIQVTMSSGRTVIARLVARDPATDLAIIKITSNGDLPLINIGTSKDLMPGEPVVAMGNAYGYEHTVTRGIISALNRTVQVTDSQQYRSLIQTDASINPGNSGGPLLNIDGEMIGINVAVRVGAQGIGFALPVDQVMEIAARLMSGRRLSNTWHGVVGETVISKTESKFVVQQVELESPAAAIALEAGDVITAVEGIKVERELDFERALLGHEANDPVKIRVSRNGDRLQLDLVVSSTTSNRHTTASKTWRLFGLQLEPVANTVIRQVSTRYRGGLRVVSVRSGSPAAAQGIRRGDVLVGMHVWETVSLDNLAYILNRNDLVDGQPVKFYVLRGNETLYGHLTIKSS